MSQNNLSQPTLCFDLTAPSPLALLYSGLSDSFYRISTSGYVTELDFLVLKSVLVSPRATCHDRRAVFRILHGLDRGWLHVVFTKL